MVRDKISVKGKAYDKGYLILGTKLTKVTWSVHWRFNSYLYENLSSFTQDQPSKARLSKNTLVIENWPILHFLLWIFINFYRNHAMRGQLLKNLYPSFVTNFVLRHGTLGRTRNFANFHQSIAWPDTSKLFLASWKFIFFTKTERSTSCVRG